MIKPFYLQVKYARNIDEPVLGILIGC